MQNRPNRDEEPRIKRRTLEDELQAGKLNMLGTPDPDRYYHVVNDTNNGVERMKLRGYRVEDGTTVRLGDMNPEEVGKIAQATANPKLVGVNGATGKAILMSIEREFKNEDDAYRQSLVDKTEESLYRNEENAVGKQGEQRYGEIKKG